MQIEDLVSSFEKNFGKGTILNLGSEIINKDLISTDLISLDYILGGGIPKGRIVEIFGQESSGKTSLSLHLISSFQKLGKLCVFIDMEHSLDVGLAKNIGVDIKNLLISQPEFGEEAFAYIDFLVKSGNVSLIVIDSVSALVPKAEIEGDYGDAHIGLQARLMSSALRKLVGTISKYETTLVFINQLRSKIGTFYGNNEVTTGGNALKYYSSLRLEVKRSEFIKKTNEDYIGLKIKIKVLKNKISPPFKVCELDFYFDNGFSKELSLLNFAIEKEIITKSGTWYSFENEKIGQGLENSLKYIKENKQVYDKIYEKIRNFLEKNSLQI